MSSEMKNTDVEGAMIVDRKQEIIAAVEEYFPNGGRDHDMIVALVDDIIDGKIPLLGLNY